MKRIIFIALTVALFAQVGFCGLITYDSGATPSESWMKSTYNTLFNEINGSLDGDNIASGGITSNDIATNTNPLVRDNENIGEYVYSGLTIATSTDLNSTITAGVAYVENDAEGTLHRVVTGSTAKAFTASKDTWVYLAYTGSFYYDEQANGATQPTTPDNHMLIAKVVTDGDNITSVTDQRTTTPTNLRIYTDYIMGCVISRDTSDTDAITIGRGEIDFGTNVTAGKRRNTTAATVNFATTGRGGLDTGSLAANTFYYLFAVADDDNTANYEGIASLSSTDATGVTNERLIGWVYSESATIISPDSVGSYRGTGSNAYNAVIRVGKTDINTTSTAIGDMPNMDAKIYTSGRPVRITFNAPFFSAANTALKVSISADSAYTGLSGSIDEDNLIGSETMCIAGIVRLPEGEHTIQVKWWTPDGVQVDQKGATDGYRMLTVEEL